MQDKAKIKIEYPLLLPKQGHGDRRTSWRGIGLSLDLPAADILRLCDYDLSGAQITNIARKATTHHVLYGTPIDVKLLEQLVEEETGYRKKTVESIGFKRGKAA